MSNKVWNASVKSTFDPRAPGQHYVAIDDLGSFSSRERALGEVKKYLKDEDYIKIYDSEETVIFSFGKKEVHVESIYVVE